MIAWLAAYWHHVAWAALAYLIGRAHQAFRDRTSPPRVHTHE